MLTLNRIFEQAQRQPAKAALVHEGLVLRYAELAHRIVGTRRFLDAQGLPGTGVAVIASTQLLDDWVLLFALRSLGFSTVAARSVAEIEALALPDIACVVLAARDGEPAPMQPDAGFPWRWLQVPRHALDATGSLPPAALSLVAAPAAGHIVRTSGTTGAYKKVRRDVPTEDSGLARLAQVFMITAGSVVFAADFPVWTAGGFRWPLCTWTVGGTVVLQSTPGPLRAPAEIAFSHVLMTPDKLTTLLRTPGAAPRRNPAMRLMVTGGALSPALLAEAQGALTTQIYSMLGSTEASIFAVTPLNRPQDLLSHRILPTREVQVVDADDRPLAPGLQGLVRSRLTDGLPGYLNDEAATRTHFRDGWFYPGDLGVFGPDGRLTLQGRESDVVNVLGNKIATAAVEQALRERLQVREVCILVLSDTGTEDELQLVIETPRALNGDDIAAAVLAEFGPLRALPVRVHFTTALPRNAMGKVPRPLLRQQLLTERQQLLTEPARRRAAELRGRPSAGPATDLPS